MVRDIRLALRRLIHAPVFLGVSVATLALAIALNSAIFSLADAVLFRPLPYYDPDQLHVLKLINAQTGQPSLSVPRPVIEALEPRTDAIAGLAPRGLLFNATHTGSDGTELIGNIAVAPNFLNVLGVQPLYGRLFDSRDLQQPAGP